MKYTIWISHSVTDFIFLNGNKWLPKETGGVLMGYRASELEFVITDIIGPGPRAIHGNSTFYPDQQYHESEIRRKYEASENSITYLGDWHTHPNAYPYLSNQDKSTIKKIAAYENARLTHPIMLIAAPPKLELKIWVYEKCRFRSVEIYYKIEIVTF